MKKSIGTEATILGAILLLAFIWSPLQSAFGSTIVLGPTVNLGTGTSVDSQKIAASSSSSTDYVYVVWRNTGNQEIYLKRSTDGGETFGSSINLSGTSSGASVAPDIIASGSNVYVVYQDNSPGNHEIFLKKSTDYGATFGTAVRVTNTASGSFTPSVAVSGSNVYVVWSENPSGSSYPDVYIAKSTNGGSSFGSPVNLSSTAGTSGGSIGTPKVIAQGSNVYVMWIDTGTTGGYGEVYFRKSSDSGSTFSSVKNLSNNAGTSQHPDMVAVGSNVYIAWMDNTDYVGSLGLGNSEIYFRKSIDGGATFSSTINLSNTASDSKMPHVAVSSTGSEVSVTWADIGAGNMDDIWYSSSTNTGSTFSTPVNLSNTEFGSSEANVRYLQSSDTSFMIWSDYPGTTYKEILMKKKAGSDQGGTIDESTTNLSKTFGSSYNLALTTIGNKVYMVWYDTTSGNNGLLFKSISEEAEASSGTTAPDAPIISSPASGTFTNDNTPTFSGTAEALSTVRLYSGSSTTPIASAAASSTGVWTATPSTAMVDGSYSITAKATDAAGNTSPASAAVNITIDTVAPAAPVISSPATGTLTNDSTPSFSGTAHAFTTIRLYDGINTTPITTTTASSTGAWTATPSAGLSNGVHSITATSTDKAGNVSPVSSSVSITIDTVAPAAPVISSPASGTSTTDTTPTFSGTAEASSTVKLYDGSGTTPIATTTASSTGSWTATSSTLTIDSHSITAKATDKAGNTSPASASASISITSTSTTDTTAPTVSITSPSDGETISGVVTVAASASDNVAVSKVDFFVAGNYKGTDTTSPYTYSLDTTTYTDGVSYSITAKATDSSGNYATTYIMVTISNSPTATDTTPPVVTPPPNQVAEATSASGAVVNYPAATATDDVDGTLTATCTPASGSTFPLGTTTVNCSATDSSGNTGTASFTVTVRDTTAPTASITSPSDGSSASGTISVTVSASDKVGVSKVDLYIDGNLFRTDTTSPYSFSLDTTTLGNGDHQLQAKVTDPSGNSGTSMAVTVTVQNTIATNDTTAPVVTITSPSDGTILKGASVTITVSATDNVAMSKVRIFIDGQLVADLTSSTSSYSYNWNIKKVTTGDHTITAVGYDTSGNTASDSITVTKEAKGKPGQNGR